MATYPGSWELTVGDLAAEYEQSLDQRAYDTIVDMGRYIEQQRGRDAQAVEIVRRREIEEKRRLMEYRPILNVEWDFASLRTLDPRGDLPPSPSVAPKPKPPGHSELTRELDID